MKDMNDKRLRAALAALGISTVISCITVNIYFPEAAVKKTAEEIVNEIREKDQPADKDADREKTEPQDQSFSWIPAVFAQEETTVSTPSIRALKESMKRRFPELVPLYEQGRIGEGNDGLVQIKDEAGLTLAEKAALRKLVKAENADRQALYGEVAKAMGIDAGQISKIRTIFAEMWVKNSKPGWWIQKPDGTWIKKR